MWNEVVYGDSDVVIGSFFSSPLHLFFFDKVYTFFLKFFFCFGAPGVGGEVFFLDLIMNFFLESYPPTVTPTEIFVNILFWGGIFVVYLLRKTPPFDAIWRVIAIFLLVLFGTVLFNRFKDKLKDFLN